mmetsp:Transcript_22514/g.52128  ORF Transcript_22514/g.52128 Transcript_22514/m.52128 type:complete len:338 (+) Transcript_22514:242-1255(+)
MSRFSLFRFETTNGPNPALATAAVCCSSSTPQPHAAIAPVPDHYLVLRFRWSPLGRAEVRHPVLDLGLFDPDVDDVRVDAVLPQQVQASRVVVQLVQLVAVHADVLLLLEEAHARHALGADPDQAREVLEVVLWVVLDEPRACAVAVDRHGLNPGVIVAGQQHAPLGQLGHLITMRLEHFECGLLATEHGVVAPFTAEHHFASHPDFASLRVELHLTPACHRRDLQAPARAERADPSLEGSRHEVNLPMHVNVIVVGGIARASEGASVIGSEFVVSGRHIGLFARENRVEFDAHASRVRRDHVRVQTGSQWHADTVELITTLLRIAVDDQYAQRGSG